MKTEHSLFFLRHGKLTLPYKDHSEMPLGVLADLASSKLNPPIDTEFASQQIPSLAGSIPLEKICKIYNSPSVRCWETARFISKFILENYGKNIEPVVAQELHEVKFNLLKILPGDDVSKVDIGSLNDSVFGAMANASEHCESAESAYQRIDALLRSSVKEEKPILFITHDFIMRIIEIYIRNNGDPRHKVTYEEIKNTKRNLYLQGFGANVSFGDFVAIQY